MTRYRAAIVFAGLSAICLLLISTEAKQLRQWKEERQSLEKTLESVKKQETKSTSLMEALETSLEETKKKGESLDTKITELEELKDQLMQGAAYQLTQIREAYDKENWQAVIDLTAKLHKDHPDAAECAIADELAATAQTKLDEIAKAAEEEAARKKAEEEEAARLKAEEEAAKAQQDEEKKKLTALKNKDLYTVLKTIDELGYTATFYETTFEWIDGEKEDGHSADVFRDSTAYPESDLKYYWKATKISNINTDSKTLDVDYILDDSGPLNTGNGKDLEARQAALEKKLDLSSAWAAVEMFGDGMYPYGFTIHLLAEPYIEELYDDDTWYLRAACTIKNEYNAKGNFHVEAMVTGTSDAPKVYGFNVY